MSKEKLTEKNLKKQWENIKRKHQIRQRFLTSIFLEISDIELIQELEKRVREPAQTIKLSLNSNQDYISVEGRKEKYVFISYLPIEIRKKDQ